MGCTFHTKVTFSRCDSGKRALVLKADGYGLACWLLPAARRKTPLLKNHHLKLPIRLTRWHPFSLTLLEAPNESGWQAESTRLLTLKIIITEKIWKWVKK
ncbi:hypothetical protein [Brevibacillus agri]|uniref:hypothetical protein n=1 Tax=Brevibacillus agri TaxID=51101 RepID=UPI001EE61702|nr:hypothetical protein [Brevibacillus agri]MCG5250341.1 hypothetical protein [Brevibacillus agri]WHX28308.1 hypothetical protein QNK09_14355 [Brevibacillus agri]